MRNRRPCRSLALLSEPVSAAIVPYPAVSAASIQYPALKPEATGRPEDEDFVGKVLRYIPLHAS